MTRTKLWSGVIVIMNGEKKRKKNENCHCCTTAVAKRPDRGDSPVNTSCCVDGEFRYQWTSDTRGYCPLINLWSSFPPLIIKHISSGRVRFYRFGGLKNKLCAATFDDGINNNNNNMGVGPLEN